MEFHIGRNYVDASPQLLSSSSDLFHRLDERKAFVRSPDGRIVVRRFFGADIAATAVSLIVPVIYIVVVALLVGLLFRWLPEGTNAIKGADR